jgi:hypothetical protein
MAGNLQADLARNPELASFYKFGWQLKDESDRGMVLIATGYLEEVLKELLVNFFVEGIDGKAMFENSGAWHDGW